MKKTPFKVIYDKESQVLSWQLKDKKSVDSSVQGNVVIDYDKQGSIVRINFYQVDFSQFKENKKNFEHFVSSKQLAVV